MGRHIYVFAEMENSIFVFSWLFLQKSLFFFICTIFVGVVFVFSSSFFLCNG